MRLYMVTGEIDHWVQRVAVISQRSQVWSRHDQDTIWQLGNTMIILIARQT
jgi:hypothetical protein